MIFFLKQPKWIKTDYAHVLILYEDFCSMMGAYPIPLAHPGDPQAGSINSETPHLSYPRVFSGLNPER